MKKNLIKLILFFLIVGMLQWLAVLFGPGMSFDNLELLEKFFKKPMDVLILGDSTNWFFADDDKDKRSISGMLKEIIPQYSTRSIAHAAYHMDVYAAFCQYIAGQKRRQIRIPEIIIIPINMRSFSPEWDMRPDYQFVKEKIILQGGPMLFFYRPLRVLKYKFDRISYQEYLDIPVYDNSQKIGTIMHIRGTKNQFILKYMYSLDDGHRKVKSMLRIVQLLAKNNIKVLFYLTPIDYQEGERCLPGRFKERMSHNIFFLKSLLSKENLIDLSLDLTSDYFAWKNKGSVNEHMNQAGRRYVAKKLAEKIKMILTKKKSKKKYSIGID